jgi:hypothetical protein
LPHRQQQQQQQGLPLVGDVVERHPADGDLVCTLTCPFAFV